MALPAGFNFRATSAYVTDTSPDVYVGDVGWPPDNTYPHTFSNGVTAGWNTSVGGSHTDGRNRSTTYPRLAGQQYSQDAAGVFQIDLPSAGSYNIQGGASDASYGTTSNATLYDSTTSLGTLWNGSPSSSQAIDATNSITTRAAWASGTNSRGGVRTQSFSSTTLRVHLAASSTISHLYVDSAAAAATSFLPSRASRMAQMIAL